MNQPGRNRPHPRGVSFPLLPPPSIVCAAVASPRAWADDPNTVVATVGDHKISEKDLDAKVKPQLEQMRAMLEKRVDQLIADKSFRPPPPDAGVDDRRLPDSAGRPGATS